jgi:pimeloyl-ACP methyl ester carboxylesterase
MSAAESTRVEQRLKHGRIEVALHTLRGDLEATASSPPVLLLHALGTDGSRWSEGLVESWPGAVYALDFAGHGDSDRVRGGAYAPEYFLADADLALHEIGGTAALVGAGIGAYVALLLAGARASRVPGALILPGYGLEGGGSAPRIDGPRFRTLEDIEAHFDEAAGRYGPGSDPKVSLCELDLRPSDYVEEFVRAAGCLLYSAAIDEAEIRPSWWDVLVRAEASVRASAEWPMAVEEFAAACARQRVEKP